MGAVDFECRKWVSSDTFLHNYQDKRDRYSEWLNSCHGDCINSICCSRTKRRNKPQKQWTVAKGLLLSTHFLEMFSSHVQTSDLICCLPIKNWMFTHTNIFNKSRRHRNDLIMQHFAVFLTLCSPVCGVSLYNNYDWVSSTCNVLHSTCISSAAAFMETMWSQ